MTEPAMDSCDPDELEAKVAKARRILRDSGNLLKKDQITLHLVWGILVDF